MANGNDPFSKSIKQENPTVPPPPRPRETPTATPPPLRATNLAAVDKNQSLLNSLRSTSLTPRETETCLGSLANVMTSSEDSDDALFQEVISKLNGSELQRMAALLTSYNDRYFQKRREMRDQILHHAVHLACDRYGSVALDAIILDVAFLDFSTALLDVVASNALLLSKDAYGSLVVRHVIKHFGLHSTRNIGVSLRGHYVELSFTEGGRCIVERLLEKDRETEELVMEELLECEGEELVRLARSVHGHSVVETALKVTRVDLRRGLVNKLKPFLPLFRKSHHAHTIVEIMESFVTN